jgi:D-amino-acid oxidase
MTLPAGLRNMEFFNNRRFTFPVQEGKDFEIEGLLPERVRLTDKEHPFKADHVTRRSNIMFNIPTYLRHHLTDFMMFGGK